MKAEFYKIGDVVEHTPSSALTAGSLVFIDDKFPAVAVQDIAANTPGNVRIKGIFKVEAAAVTGDVGDPIGWDLNGSPYGGEASSGAATTTLASADHFLGTLVKELTATDGYAYVLFNEFMAKALVHGVPA